LFEQEMRRVKSETELEISVQNGNIPDGFDNKIDSRGGRNMTDLATNQTVLTAWQ